LVVDTIVVVVVDEDEDEDPPPPPPHPAKANKHASGTAIMDEANLLDCINFAFSCLGRADGP
jgi:hypothetical protein